MIRYDPRVIQRFADRLYVQAVLIIIVCTVVGAAVGGYLAYSATRFDYRSVQRYVFIGLAAGGTLGCGVGLWRSFVLRLRAQLALCQMRIEANTRAAASNAASVPQASAVD